MPTPKFGMFDKIKHKLIQSWITRFTSKSGVQIATKNNLLLRMMVRAHHLIPTSYILIFTSYCWQRKAPLSFGNMIRDTTSTRTRNTAPTRTIERHDNIFFLHSTASQNAFPKRSKRSKPNRNGTKRNETKQPINQTIQHC